MSGEKTTAKPFKAKLKKVCNPVFYGAVTAATLLAPYGGAVAQTSDSIENVVVVGIRGGLTRAVDIKRNSDSVVDAISAEDIGKFPDNNVAESLARVPGVSVSRQFGEGSKVSIRGASDQLTLTTLNGQNVASTGWYSQQAIDRSFNYSMLPPEVIAGIEVYKSSQADLVEGGVGGTVNVRTRKPLDLDSGTGFVSAKAADSSTSDETDVSLSGLYSFKNESETLGALVSVAQSDYSLVRFGTEALPSWGGRIGPVNFNQERNRTAVDVVAQYSPNEAWDVTVHYLDLELEADGTNHAAFIPQDTSNCQTNAQGVPILCSTAADFDPIARDTFYEARTRLATMTSETIDLSVDYHGDGFQASFQAGATEASGGTDFESQIAYISGVGGATGTIDATGDVIDFQLTDPTFTLPTAGNYFGWEGLQPGQIVQQPNTDEESYFQGDLEFDVDWGAVNSIKTGLRITEHDVEQTKFRPIMPRFNGDAEAARLNGSDFTNGTLEVGMDHYTAPRFDAQAVVDYANSFIDGYELERPGYASLNEENTAAYVMATFETEKLRGNVGLRYIQTDVETSFYGGDASVTGEFLATNNLTSRSLSTVKSDYSEILPSLNIAYDLNDDLVLRFSAAEVISRPNYNDLFGNQALVGFSDAVPGNEAVAQGNVALSPFKAFQSDLALEWYFAQGSIASVGLFTKDVDSFPIIQNIPNQQIGLISPDTGVDNWLLQTKVDGAGASVNGVEFQFQHALDNGVGFAFNYTYADAEADSSDTFNDGNLQLTDGSKNSYNAVVYYENDKYSARAAYAWRDAYFIREIGFYGGREHQDFGTLDLSFNWKATDSVDVSLQINNVTEEDSVQIGRDLGTTAVSQRTSFGYPSYTYQGERRIIIGISARF